jgi:hypothetical protein
MCAGDIAVVVRPAIWQCLLDPGQSPLSSTHLSTREAGSAETEQTRANAIAGAATLRNARSSMGKERVEGFEGGVREPRVPNRMPARATVSVGSSARSRAPSQTAIDPATRYRDRTIPLAFRSADRPLGCTCHALAARGLRCLGLAPWAASGYDFHLPSEAGGGCPETRTAQPREPGPVQAHRQPGPQASITTHSPLRRRTRWHPSSENLSL